jgi:hypothetical protein
VRVTPSLHSGFFFFLAVLGFELTALGAPPLELVPQPLPGLLIRLKVSEAFESCFFHVTFHGLHLKWFSQSGTIPEDRVANRCLLAPWLLVVPASSLQLCSWLSHLDLVDKAGERAGREKQKKL